MSDPDVIADTFMAKTKNGTALFRASDVLRIVPHPHPDHGLSVIVTKDGDHEACLMVAVPCTDSAEVLIGRWQLAAQAARQSDEAGRPDGAALTEIAKQLARLSTAAWSFYDAWRRGR